MTHDMNVIETARYLNYHPQTVRDLARLGKLPAIKRGQAWRFSKSELVAFLKAQTQAHVDRSRLSEELSA